MSFDRNGIYIEVQGLEDYAKNVALDMKVNGKTQGSKIALAVRKSLRLISQVHDSVRLQWQDEASVPPAVSWLLDNHYLARREGLTAAESFHRASSLRSQGDESVLMALCSAFLHSGQDEVSAERLEAFLCGFQKGIVLNRDEIGYLINGLRSQLIFELCRVCESIAASGDDGELEAQIKSIFTSLRYLATADLRKVLERADFVEQTLQKDPAGIYPLMDEATRALYRKKTQALAKNYHAPEHRVAKRILDLSSAETGDASHVGYFLFEKPLGESKNERGGAVYISFLLVITLFLSLYCGFLSKSVLCAILLVVPFSEFVKSIMDFIILRWIEPAHIPRMELKGGAPSEAKTLCVVSAIIAGGDDGKKLANALLEHRLSNRDAGENLLFAVLSDFPESKSEYPEGSEAWLDSARQEIEKHNQSYGGGFYLFSRPRYRSENGKYMGYERKRGAIDALMHFLRREDSNIICLCGDVLKLSGTNFVITLDTDTRLNPGSALNLIGAMMHPLNKPVIDSTRRIVKAGYGVINPRISVDLPSSIKSDFSHIFAGQGGTDPYSNTCGNLYMDVWQSGGFYGKGIISVDAYMACIPGLIPENRVLSHDSIEGAFLRGGYMSDTELTDSFPSGALSYYKRMHRWIRGDVQNLPWVFRKGRQLRDIERFKLFDNFRRALAPVMTFLSIFLSFFIFGGGMAIAAYVAVLSYSLPLVLTAIESLFHQESERTIRYHSSIFYGIGGGIVQAILKLILLPIECYYCLDAICKAAWRMCISKHNLLAWQTAAQSDALGRGVGKYLASMWIPVLFGLAAFVFSPAIIGKAVGFIWLLSPLIAYVLSIETSGSAEPLSGDESQYLLGCAKDIWEYFNDFWSENDNFLPPDNFQRRPPVGVAHRTSPTNIALAILSGLAAADLGITDKERIMYLVSRTLDTIEGLPKWNGHLYNWYDTQTLTPLNPPYVSTVDSGNFYASLVAARQALLSYDRPDLANRVSSIMDGMNFSPLFDESRQLFVIGIDTFSGKKPNSWYDLMASEATLTGYISIAKGDVPRQHWRKLSRAQLQKNGYRGMASWTGTMFEYLMPSLLLPIHRNSLIFESSKFCVYAQRKRTAHLGVPWGISESAFYSLDSSMSYRYKAHGCASLALKRGMDDELVVSPYSSFLALAVSPRAAVKNLRLLDSLGMRGKYGFWEALDYTKSRRSNKGASKVRCVMSHHAGMSMVAIANCLSGGIFQKRFMQDPSMSAHQILLQEKVPIGGPVLHRHVMPPRQKPTRYYEEHWQEKFEGTDYFSPSCCLLSSGIYSATITEAGQCSALWGAVSPYVSKLSPLDNDKGVNFSLILGQEEISLLPNPSQKGEFSAIFGTEKASFKGEFETYQTEAQIALTSDQIGEIRKIKVKNQLYENRQCRLKMSLLPLLAKKNDYVNHPAFYGLGLSARVLNGALVIRRLARGATGEIFMCIACDRAASFSAQAGGGLGRDAKTISINAEEVWLNGETINCLLDFSLGAGSSLEANFAIAMGRSEEKALSSARQILHVDEADFANMPCAAATVIGMANEHIGEAWQLLTPLLFPPPPKGKDFARDNLWKFGISGDLPIVCAEYESNDSLDNARRLLDAHLLITGCGVDFDLVFITHDNSDYQRSLNTALSDALWRNGGEALFAKRGGVHIIDASRGADCVAAAAAMNIDLSMPLVPAERMPQNPNLLSSHLPAVHRGGETQYAWSEVGDFVFNTRNALPKRAWSIPLTNGRFGYLASDCGTGNLWHLNSRENQISPWLCKPTDISGPESLLVSCDIGTRSLFASSDGEDTSVRFGFGYAVWEKSAFGMKIRTTAFVPQDIDARVLIIECDNPNLMAKLHWKLDLTLSSAIDDGRYAVTSMRSGALCASSSRAIDKAVPLMAIGSDEFSGFTCDGVKAAMGIYDSAIGNCQSPAFAAEIKLVRAFVLVCGCDDYARLKSLANIDAATMALEETKAFWLNKLSAFSMKSENQSLDRIMNGWIYYQSYVSRIQARCSIYQSGGAFGFRDQLQDCANLIALDSALCRDQIIKSCSRQYLEGDVQHWWHEGSEVIRGVRTRCSDDLVWLVWALCEYVEKTGDRQLCLQSVSYLTSPVLAENEKDRYEAAEKSDKNELVLLHCVRALEKVLERGTGSHGLLRFGSGDWNDGMDAVSGESQWLTWFFSHTATRFARILENHNADLASKYLETAKSLAQAANAAWDGKWFVRGYFPDGTPLGSYENEQCRIDSIAQSFAAICEFSDKDKTEIALSSALKILHDKKHGIVKLFDPPFLNNENYPGYIESYGPGFRENGGQYTHGALWLAMALFETARPDEGFEVLEAVLPACKNISTYLAEPFVIAADVYSTKGREGEGGWSWYTGSAGWLFRIVTQSMLGLKMESGKLYIRPNLPSKLQNLSINFRGIAIKIKNGRVFVNEKPYQLNGLNLSEI